MRPEQLFGCLRSNLGTDNLRHWLLGLLDPLLNHRLIHPVGFKVDLHALELKLELLDLL